MHITCITVCVGYADYLRRTTYWNFGQFDKHLIVTSYQDNATVITAADHGMYTFISDAFYMSNATFNKAAAINHALVTLQPDDWVLFMDADILLPVDFRANLELEALDPEKLYYTHRGTVFRDGLDASLEALKLKPELRYAEKHKVLHHGIDTLPWGYFQLVNAKCSKLVNKKWAWMAAHHKSANEYDTEFMNMWPKSQHVLLPQKKFKVLHMGHGPRGQNWNGRVTESLDV